MTPCQFPVTPSRRTSPMVPNMKLPNGNELYHKAKEMLQKARQPKHGVTKLFWKYGPRTINIASLCQILSWLKSRLFSMTNLHWKTTLTLQQRRKELATRKIGYSSWMKNVFKDHWINVLYFVEAKREKKRLHDEHVKEPSEGNTPIHPSHRTRQRRNQQFEGLEEYNYQVDPRTGWRSYLSKSQGSLRHPTSSSSSNQWEQHDDWKSNKSWNSWRPSSEMPFRLREIRIPWQSFEELQNLFDITQKLMLDHQTEILNVTTMARSALTIRWHGGRKQKYVSTQIPYYAWGTCQIIQKRIEDEVEEFRLSTSYRELLGFDGELIDFEWNISQDLRHWRSSRRSRKTCKIANLEPEDFEDRIIFMSMFNDIEWTKRGNSEQCISNSEKVNKYAKRFSRGHLAIPRPRKWKEVVRKSQLHTWRKMRFHRHRDGGGISKKPVTQYSRVSVIWVVEFWKERITETPCTSMRMLQTQNSFSERFTQQVSSVSAEHSQPGVKISVKRPNKQESTSERFVAKEIEQLLKSVKLQEVNSLVQTPSCDHPSPGNRLQRCVILEKSLYWNVLQDHCRRRWWFWRSNSSMQRVYSVQTRADSDSRIYAAILSLEPVIQVHIIQFPGTHGIEIQIPSTTTPNRTPWVLICRGKKRDVMSHISKIQDTIPRVVNYFWIDLLQKKVSLVLQTDRVGAIPHRGNSCDAVRNSDESSVQLFRRSYSFWRKEVEWHSCLQTFQRTYFWSRSPKIGHETGGTSLWSRKRETDGAVHWNSLGSKKYEKHFRKRVGENSRTPIDFNTFMKEATRWGSQYCMNSKHFFLCTRATQGHTGGNLIAPELMGHIANPYKLKEFLFHRGCSLHVHFNPQIRTHRWRTRKQRRKTDHLLHTSRGQSRRRRS